MLLTVVIGYTGNMYLSNLRAIRFYEEFYILKIKMKDNGLVNLAWLRMVDRLSKKSFNL